MTVARFLGGSMKQILISFAAICATFAGVSAFADIITKEVVITVSDVFVPGKVSASEDAKVVVSGMFPNSCYSWSRAEVREKDQKDYNVRAMAMVSQTMCLMVLVPYTKEINLGHLPPGEHLLRFINGDDTWFEKKLVVE
jgi:hypothetical protein